MPARSLLILLLALSLALSAASCSHKPLKAPCEPGEATPLSASFTANLLPILPDSWMPFLLPLVTAGKCGPLRRL